MYVIMCQTFLNIDIYSLQHLKFQAERSLIKSQKNCVLMNSQNSVLSYAETILLQKTLKYWYYWSTRHSRHLNYPLKKNLPHIYCHFHYLWKLIKEDESSSFAKIDRFSTNYIQCNLVGFEGERKSASSFCNLRKVIHRSL